MSPFCSPAENEVVLHNDCCYARFDRYPVSNGHLLIVPFRHEPSFLRLTAEEQAAALALLSQAAAKLTLSFAQTATPSASTSAKQPVKRWHTRISTSSRATPATFRTQEAGSGS